MNICFLLVKYNKKNEQANEKYIIKKLATPVIKKAEITKYAIPIGIKKQVKYFKILLLNFKYKQNAKIPTKSKITDENEMLNISSIIPIPATKKIKPTRYANALFPLSIISPQIYSNELNIEIILSLFSPFSDENGTKYSLSIFKQSSIFSNCSFR